MMAEVPFPTPSEVEERLREYEQLFCHRYTTQDDDFCMAGERRSKPRWSCVPSMQPWPPRRGRRGVRSHHDPYHSRQRYQDSHWRQRGGRSPRNDFEYRENPSRWDGRHDHSPPPSPRNRPQVMSPVSPDKQAFRKEPPLKAELPELQPKQMEIGAQGTTSESLKSHPEVVVGFSPFETETKSVPTESDCKAILDFAKCGSSNIKAKTIPKQAHLSKKQKEDSIRENNSDSSTKKLKEKPLEKDLKLVSNEDSTSANSVEFDSSGEGLRVPHSKQSASMVLVSHGKTETVHAGKQDSLFSSDHSPVRRSGKERVRRKKRRQKIVSDDDDSDGDVDVITLPDTDGPIARGSLTVSLALPTSGCVNSNWSESTTTKDPLIVKITPCDDGTRTNSYGQPPKKKHKKKSKHKQKDERRSRDTVQSLTVRIPKPTSENQ